ncbi:MAG TPA: LysR family transcriptional regulator [Bacteriovoracaceae bacterium]|nr:LysR family transcriptional regulator [Bacteriovoracaceae bacterium]
MRLNNLDLNKLKCFQAVAEKSSLLEGARTLGLTPSAVYQSIKRLEDEIKRHLFFRAGKKYVLTEDGRSLQLLYERFLWDLSEFQRDLRNGTEVLEGEIRVGLPLNFSKSVFIPVLKNFTSEHPGVKFLVTVAESRRLLIQVCAFELDFAVTDDSIPAEFGPKIAKKEVFREELIMVCSKEFYRQHQQEISSIKSMKELPHLDYSKNLPLIQRWYKLHYKRQAKVRSSHIIDNVETMVSALTAGLGLGVIPRDFLLKASQTSELQVISPKSGTLYNPLYLVQDGNYINNTLMKKFLQYLSQSL